MADQPNGEWTKIPNAILDAVAQFSEAELRLLLVVARKTIGFHKACDLISLTQFEQATGLSRPSVNATLKRLVANGCLEQMGKGKRGVNCYRLGSGLVNSVNQLSQATSKLSSPELVNSVNQTSPGLVNSVNTQKKESKERKKERESHTPAQANMDSLHEGVAIYKQLSGIKFITPTVAATIAATANDLTLWERAVKTWIGVGNKPGNITGICDWYNHPERMERRNGTHQSNRPRTAHPNAPSRHGYAIERPDNREPDDTG